MTHAPNVAFGLAALAIALKAKCGRATNGARIEFARLTIELLPLMDGPAAPASAAAEFLRAVERDPAAAGRGLQDFLERWMDTLPVRQTEQVLAGIEAEQLHDWQRRADTGLD